MYHFHTVAAKHVVVDDAPPDSADPVLGCEAAMVLAVPGLPLQSRLLTAIRNQGYHSEPNSIRYALKRHLFCVVLA